MAKRDPDSKATAAKAKARAETDKLKHTTNELWRGIMVRARTEHKLTQEQLGRLVGASQVAIAKIEAGQITTSKYIGKICDELSIPLPEHTRDKDDSTWIMLGRLLRANPKNEDLALDLLYKILGTERPTSTDEDDASEPAPTSK